VCVRRVCVRATRVRGGVAGSDCPCHLKRRHMDMERPIFARTALHRRSSYNERPSLDHRHVALGLQQSPAEDASTLSGHLRYLSKLANGTKPTYLHKLMLDGTKIVVLASKWGADARMARQAASMESVTEHIESGAVVTEVESHGEMPEFWRQGDVSLHTEDVMKQRLALKQDPEVTEALHVFWLAVLRSVQSGDEAHEDASTTLHEEGYHIVFSDIYRALLEEWDPKDAHETIAEEWEEDTRGEGDLTRIGFYDCMFELADSWTHGVSADEYVAFLMHLLDDISTVHEDDGLRYIWHGAADDGEAPHFDSTAYSGLVGKESDVDLLGGNKKISKRQKRQEKHKARRRAAMKIQARIRGKSKRRLAATRRGAVVAVEAGWRGHVGREEAKLRRQAAQKDADEVLTDAQVRRRAAQELTALDQTALQEEVERARRADMEEGQEAERATAWCRLDAAEHVALGNSDSLPISVQQSRGNSQGFPLDQRFLIQPIRSDASRLQSTARVQIPSWLKQRKPIPGVAANMASPNSIRWEHTKGSELLARQQLLFMPPQPPRSVASTRRPATSRGRNVMHVHKVVMFGGGFRLIDGSGSSTARARLQRGFTRAERAEPMRGGQWQHLAATHNACGNPSRRPASAPGYCAPSRICVLSPPSSVPSSTALGARPYSASPRPARRLDFTREPTQRRHEGGASWGKGAAL
jgi:hypothetical protein